MLWVLIFILLDSYSFQNLWFAEYTSFQIEEREAAEAAAVAEAQRAREEAQAARIRMLKEEEQRRIAEQERLARELREEEERAVCSCRCFQFLG